MACGVMEEELPSQAPSLSNITFKLGWCLVWECWTVSIKPGTCGLWFPSAAGWIMLSKLVPTAEASLEDVLRTENHKLWAVQQSEFLTLSSSNPGLFCTWRGTEKDCFSLLFVSLNSLPSIFRRLIDFHVMYTWTVLTNIHTTDSLLTSYTLIERRRWNVKRKLLEECKRRAAVPC